MASTLIVNQIPQVLSKSSEPMTAEAILEALKRRGICVTKTIVKQALDLLVSQGITHELMRGNKTCYQ